MAAAETRAAEALQGWLDGQNALQPPLYDPPWFAGRYRHTCPVRADRSTALDLKERYVTLQELIDREEVDGWEFDYSGADEVDVELGIEDTSPRSVAIIYREGRCKFCGQEARSSVGKVVNVADRPPLEGRVAR